MTRTGAVRRILVESSRTVPSVIRDELTFQEGDLLTEEDLDQSRSNLLRLGLFRELNLDAEWSDELDGYDVRVRADDGWFIFPLPMAGSRGGDSFTMLMVMQRNYFRRSEGIMLLGSRSADRTSGMALVTLPRGLAVGGYEDSRMDLFEYADGAVNVKRFSSDGKGERADDFGRVVNRYRRQVRRSHAMVGGRLSPEIRWSTGLSFSQVDYRPMTNQVPGDAGDANSWHLSLEYGGEGRGDPALQGGAFGAFGRVFGLGMAGVKDGLVPLAKTEFSRAIRLTLERGEPGLGSDQEFTRGVAGMDFAALFRDRSLLTLSVKGGVGDDLPPSQQFGAGQRGWLKGVYAREYRGDRIVSGTVSWLKPFFRTSVGMFTAEAFGDYALCGDGDGAGDKQGLGLNLVYRFWRFPLPLGGGATYSLDDDNWQFSVAIGGMF